MRFLVDENLPVDLVAALRDEGHDVVWVPDRQRAAKDAEIWRWAVAEERILVTNDLDFPLSPPSPPGMLLLRGTDRVPTATMSNLALLAVRSLGDEILGLLIVVSPGRLRRRQL